MRISIAVMNSESLSFSVEPYTFSVHESNDVCHYKSRITNIDGKILVTWVVCSDIKQNDGCFSVVGMYYNPATNTFSTDDNQKDENGNLIPMTFVDGRNYISEYSVAKLAGGIAVLLRRIPTANALSMKFTVAPPIIATIIRMILKKPTKTQSLIWQCRAKLQTLHRRADMALLLSPLCRISAIITITVFTSFQTIPHRSRVDNISYSRCFRNREHKIFVYYKKLYCGIYCRKRGHSDKNR